MSYNNYTDADAAHRAAYDFDSPAVAIIKHANPCGIALGQDIAEAHRKAHACDPVSAFGGVIAANRPISEAAARQIAEVFTEVVIAPDYEPGALEVLQTKKNVRVLKVAPRRRGGVESRPLPGGLLLQSVDALDAPGDSPEHWELVSGEPADAATLADLEFAWRACRAVKSNAILLASEGASVGVGMGQVNRVDSCRLAVERAGERAAGSVAASDAFFPFPDGPAILVEAGVRAIVQPGGSVRDADTIAAVREGRPFPPPHDRLYDRFMSGPVNPIFYACFVKSSAFTVSEACTGCGQCVRRCPTNSITLRDAKPVWGKGCTHCMACICYCPTSAIEYGKKSLGKPRYHFEAL